MYQALSARAVVEVECFSGHLGQRKLSFSLVRDKLPAKDSEQRTRQRDWLASALSDLTSPADLPEVTLLRNMRIGDIWRIRMDIHLTGERHTDSGEFDDCLRASHHRRIHSPWTTERFSHKRKKGHK